MTSASAHSETHEMEEYLEEELELILQEVKWFKNKEFGESDFDVRGEEEREKM